MHNVEVKADCFNSDGQFAITLDGWDCLYTVYTDERSIAADQELKKHPCLNDELREAIAKAAAEGIRAALKDGRIQYDPAKNGYSTAIECPYCGEDTEELVQVDCSDPDTGYHEIRDQCPACIRDEKRRDAEAEGGLHPLAPILLGWTEDAGTRDCLVCDSCGHTAKEHDHEERGYEECNVLGCPCKWFNHDSAVWERTK